MITSWSFRSFSDTTLMLAGLILGTVLLPLGCKDSGEVVAPSGVQVIHVNLSNADTYQYTTAASGDEEGAVITRQARHSRRSEILRDASTNFVPVYFYQPETGYTGEDSVDLEIHTNKVGTPEASQVSSLGFRFTISQ